ncbi:hypothetical protein [Nocardia nova]|uniref:hypothetical protein n=1 Tax=Nocardia nova TaxID=37330 RepID=UPI001CA55EDF|nr:hypothetical protein [Nocardia nova]
MVSVAVPAAVVTRSRMRSARRSRAHASSYNTDPAAVGTTPLGVRSNNATPT